MEKRKIFVSMLRVSNVYKNLHTKVFCTITVRLREREIMIHGVMIFVAMNIGIIVKAVKV